LQQQLLTSIRPHTNKLSDARYSALNAKPLKQADNNVMLENGNSKHNNDEIKVIKTATTVQSPIDKEFNEVADSVDTTATSESLDGVKVTTAVNNDDQSIAGVKVVDSENDQTVSIVNNDGKLIVTKIMLESNSGLYKTESSTFNVNTSNIGVENVSTGWRYTNLAVGTRAFGYSVDTAVVGLGTAAVAAALPAAAATALGVSTAAMRSIVSTTTGFGFGYLATVKSPGTYLASKLDTNHNGWIGIYQRTINNRNVPNYYKTN